MTSSSCLRRLWLGNDYGGPSKNELTGPIPAELGQLRALTRLFLDGNKLSGAIPAELGQLGALAGLYLSENELSGAIPAELGQLGALQFLYLYENQQLTGHKAFRAYMEEHHPDCQLLMDAAGGGRLGASVATMMR